VPDPLIARFADACGSTGSLHLRVDLAGGGALAEGTVDQPFTLVGRDEACDVTLNDAEVNPRHAWLQVIGGRVFLIDLGSRTGVLWPNGTRGSGWLEPGAPARLGPFHLNLRHEAGAPGASTDGYNPLAADPALKAKPSAALEFRNGRRVKDRWQVNRLVTLIGRSLDCKIHLNADDIAPYHCGLVATGDGLWVVDLSGHGVVVNGERMRVSPLPHGAELWVGRFLIGCHSPNPASVAARPVGPRPGASGTLSASPEAPRATPVPLAVSRAPDEIDLGAVSDAGLPGSHIMADIFRAWVPNVSEPLSNPILLSGSGPKPVPQEFAPAPTTAVAELLDDLVTPPGACSVVPLLRQMADLHGRADAEFQQLVALMAQALARVPAEHVPALRHDLGRIIDVSAEIAALRTEVARTALSAAAARAIAAESRLDQWVAPSSKTPVPEGREAQHARAVERLAALQRDRAERWQAVLLLFTNP
jgi:pSer/pThr/pTyr-binding forkhead associated (FHA) protein